MLQKTKLTVSEDRSELAMLLVSSEGQAIKITLSNGSFTVLRDGWSFLGDWDDTDRTSIKFPNSDHSWVMETNEIVRVNDLSSGELLWETQRGQLTWASHPPQKSIRVIAALYLPIWIAAVLYHFLGWNFLGEWDGYVLVAILAGAVILISYIPDTAEIV